MINYQVSTYLINMTLAAYMSRDPVNQVRRMAKRYKKNTKDKQTRKSMSVIVKHPRPDLVVRKAYDELTS